MVSLKRRSKRLQRYQQPKSLPKGPLKNKQCKQKKCHRQSQQQKRLPLKQPLLLRVLEEKGLREGEIRVVVAAQTESLFTISAL
jgi:hypothetical protein